VDLFFPPVVKNGILPFHKGELEDSPSFSKGGTGWI